MMNPNVEVASMVESCKVPESSLEMEGETDSTSYVMIRNLKTLHTRPTKFCIVMLHNFSIIMAVYLLQVTLLTPRFWR